MRGVRERVKEGGASYTILHSDSILHAPITPPSIDCINYHFLLLPLIHKFIAFKVSEN